MRRSRRPPAFWIIIAFLAVSIPLMLTGQTMALVDYDLAERLGLQESLDEVGEYGVEVNRAFGVGDTFVFVPLLAASLAGLLGRRRWSLVTTAGAFGVSAYWSLTIAAMLGFLPGASGYRLEPGVEYALFVGAYLAFGVWGLCYLVLRGDTLLR